MQVSGIRVALGHAADELKRAEGIISTAGEGAENRAALFLRDLPDSGKILFRAGFRAMGGDEKDLLALRQVTLGIIDDGGVEFGIVDAGGEADAVILREGGGRRTWRPCGW